MSIQQTATTSFKVELFQGVHNFGPTSPDTFKLALYTDAANIGPDTAEYTVSGEVTDAGYPAGGEELVITVAPTWGINVNNVPTAFVSFADTSIPASISARAGLIYNYSKGNRSVAVLDFGATKISTTEFAVAFPVADANNAIVRIS